MEDMTPSKLAGYTYELHIQLHERQIKWVSMDKTMKDEIRCVYVHMFLDMYDVWMQHIVKKTKTQLRVFFGVSVIHSKLEIPSHGSAYGAKQAPPHWWIHSSATGVGERLIEIEVLSISGECMLTLNVAGSMLGRELWKLILDELPVKPGRQLVLSHNTAKLVLHDALQQQGFRSEREQVSATYVPIDLLAALRFARGRNVEDEEFSLNGITEMTGVKTATCTFRHHFAEEPSHLDICTWF